MHVSDSLCMHVHRAQPDSEMERSGKVSSKSEKVPWGASSCMPGRLRKHRTGNVAGASCLHVSDSLCMHVHRAQPDSEMERSGKVSSKSEKVPWGASSCMPGRSIKHKETHK